MSTQAIPAQKGTLTEKISPGQRIAGKYHSWFVLATVIIGTFMAVLDIFIVNVAIPSIAKGLNTNFSAVELVIAGYTLAYAVLVITGGRLGDLYGYKRLFMIGIAGFTLSSASCGLAPTIPILVVARVIQGISAALMYPQVLSIIQVTFTGRERNIALGVFGAVIGLASIVGQLLGGFLLQANLWGLSWRLIFLVNVPFGALALVASSILLVNQQRSARRMRLDIIGGGIVTVTLLLLVVPLVDGREIGWPLWMIGLLLAAIPFFALFAWFEERVTRRGGSPLVNLALFKQRTFTVGILIALAFFAGNAGFLFVFTLFLQLGLGFSPFHAGLTFLPFSIGFLVSSLLAPRLIPRLGRGILSLGYITTALGIFLVLAVVHLIGASISSWALAPTLLILGFGEGLGLTPLVGSIVSGVQTRDAGMAAGVAATIFQVGNVLGIAAIGLVFFFALGIQAASSARPLLYITALSGTLLCIIALDLIACGLVWLLPHTKKAQTVLVGHHLPHHQIATLGYTLCCLTGAHVGEHFIDEMQHHILQHTTAQSNGTSPKASTAVDA
jgi:EmrB/QacA subfamily drug resistance transporter